MTTNNPYSHATSAYQTRQQNVMSGFEVAVELYKGMIKFIRAGKECHKQGDLEAMCNDLQKATKIITTLHTNVNFKEGGEAALFLNSFYMDLFKDLTFILRANDTQAKFDEIIARIQPVYEIWCQHAANERGEAASASTPPANESGSTDTLQ